MVGRSGSTSVLTKLNAHPALFITGENSDQIGAALDLWGRAARQSSAEGAWHRGKVSPAALLCDLQRWFVDLSAGGPSGVVRGFKEIRWGLVDTNSTELALAKLSFMDVLFPCSRFLFVTRSNITAQRASFARTFAEYPSDEQLRRWRSKFGEMHDRLRAGGQALRADCVLMRPIRA